MQPAKTKLVNGIKIREGYVPRLKKPKVMTQMCPRCNQPIPVTEMTQHVKIELLDPKWREQRARASEKNNKYSSNIVNNSIVSDNLKRLAESRKDIFGGEEDALSRAPDRKSAGKRNAVVWDGTKESIKSVREQAQNIISDKERDELAALLHHDDLLPDAKRLRKN